MKTNFEDIFSVLELDKDGKFFDKVSRLYAESETFKMSVTIDWNCEVQPIAVGDKLRLVLTDKLHDGSSPDDNELNPEFEELEMEIMRHFDYVMHGQVYRTDLTHTSDGEPQLTTYVSFGGLLMMIKGHASNLDDLRNGKYVFLLMKKL